MLTWESYTQSVVSRINVVNCNIFQIKGDKCHKFKEFTGILLSSQQAVL